MLSRPAGTSMIEPQRVHTAEPHGVFRHRAGQVTGRRRASDPKVSAWVDASAGTGKRD